MEPLGGLSLWAELNAPLSTSLSMMAAPAGVIAVPGSRFGVDGTLERFLRIPFALPPDRLDEAVRRLAGVWRQLDRTAPPLVVAATPRGRWPTRRVGAEYGRDATPSTRACAATAAATAGATRGSNGVGTMRSGASWSATTSPSAAAAASFIPSVIARAPASKAPANTPGNARTLLIWFG